MELLLRLAFRGSASAGFCRWSLFVVGDLSVGLLHVDVVDDVFHRKDAKSSSVLLKSRKTLRRILISLSTNESSKSWSRKLTRRRGMHSYETITNLALKNKENNLSKERSYFVYFNFF